MSCVSNSVSSLSFPLHYFQVTLRSDSVTCKDISDKRSYHKPADNSAGAPLLRSFAINDIFPFPTSTGFVGNLQYQQAGLAKRKRIVNIKEPISSSQFYETPFTTSYTKIRTHFLISGGSETYVSTDHGSVCDTFERLLILPKNQLKQECRILLYSKTKYGFPQIPLKEGLKNTTSSKDRESGLQRLFQWLTYKLHANF